MESYIVRIYRRHRSSPYNLVGVIEEVDTNGMRSFHTVGELLGFFMEGGLKEEVSDSEKRSAERIQLKLPVKIRWTAPDGKEFTEETALENISSNGACLSINANIGKGVELRLVVDPERSQLMKKARVIRILKSDTQKRVGVLFNQ